MLTLDAVIKFLTQQVDDETRDYLKPLLDEALQDEQGFSAFSLSTDQRLGAIGGESYLLHKDILAGRFGHLLECDHPAIHVLNALKRLARQSIFGQREVESLELSGYAAMRGVLLSLQ